MRMFKRCVCVEGQGAVLVARPSTGLRPRRCLMRGCFMACSMIFMHPRVRGR
jgi:hypothetical protein